MTSEREVDLAMVRILDRTDRPQDMVNLMKHVIELDARLSADERNLLAVSYKGVITVRRNGIRTLIEFLNHEETKNSETRREKVMDFRIQIVQELDQHCLELIGIIDEKLLPVAEDSEAKVFYEKMRADYYRYISENKKGAEKDEYANKASDAYKKALEIAESDISKHGPTYLGLILNYSVYLYEIVGMKEEAIALAETTLKECSETVDDSSEDTIQDAVGILKLLRDNVQLWVQPE